MPPPAKPTTDNLWVTLWCFLRHGWSWEFVRAGAFGYDASSGINTWWCPRCECQRKGRF